LVKIAEYFCGYFSLRRRSVASYTTDEKRKIGQKDEGKITKLFLEIHLMEKRKEADKIRKGDYGKFSAMTECNF